MCREEKGEVFAQTTKAQRRNNNNNFCNKVFFSLNLIIEMLCGIARYDMRFFGSLLQTLLMEFLNRSVTLNDNNMVSFERRIIAK